MARPRHYSPEIRRDLVTRLYFRAKGERMPMTKLVNRLLDEAMINVVAFDQSSNSTGVAKSPAPPTAA